MSKVYLFGEYVEVADSRFSHPEEARVVEMCGRKTKFTHCHWLMPGTILVGYSSKKKKWAELDSFGYRWLDSGLKNL